MKEKRKDRFRNKENNKHQPSLSMKILSRPWSKKALRAMRSYRKQERIKRQLLSMKESVRKTRIRIRRSRKSE